MQPLKREERRSKIRSPLATLLVPLFPRKSAGRLMCEMSVLRLSERRVCRHIAGHVKLPLLFTSGFIKREYAKCSFLAVCRIEYELHCNSFRVRHDQCLMNCNIFDPDRARFEMCRRGGQHHFQRGCRRSDNGVENAM